MRSVENEERDSMRRWYRPRRPVVLGLSSSEGREEEEEEGLVEGEVRFRKGDKVYPRKVGPTTSSRSMMDQMRSVEIFSRSMKSLRPA